MMGKPPFKRTAFKLQGTALKAIIENVVLEMHPELIGHMCEIEMIMDCENESITVKVDVCENRNLFLDRPEQGKHLDS